MTRRLLLQLLLCTACTGVVAVLENNTSVESRPKDLDYRYYDKDGREKWCVYCMDIDFQKNYGESECYEKPDVGRLIEKQEWHGQTRDFWPVCGSLFTDRQYFRYIKNCTEPPRIEGATVNCTDQNGRQLLRVHDTCRVNCTTPRTRANASVTTCDPWTATWTPAACVPDACPPLSSVIGRESETSCDPDIDLPLDTTCDVLCNTPTGHDSTTRLMQCLHGRWKTVKPCPALSACPQLGNMIKEDESTSCNVSKWLPSNTTCEITCPEGYSPESRVMECLDRKWTAVRTCAPQPEDCRCDRGPDQNIIIGPTSMSQPCANQLGAFYGLAHAIWDKDRGPMWMVGLYVVGGLLLLIASILAIVLWKKCRHRNNDSGNKDVEDKTQSFPLITTPSISTTTGSECRVSLVTPSEEDETSFSTDDTTSTGSKVGGEEEEEELKADDPPPPYSSSDVNEHILAVMEPPSFNKGNFAALQACNRVEIFYRRDDDEDLDHRLPESCEIQTPAGSRLTLFAVCGDRHRIVQFYFGPSFIGDEHESLETGVRLHVTRNTQGNYLLCGKCSQGGEVVGRVFIRVNDNPDETYVKEIYRQEDEFDSLNSTETEHNMSGDGGEPSKHLEAEPFSLPSNPSLGNHLQGDSEEEEYLEAWGGARAGGGARAEMGRASAEMGGLAPAVSNLSLASRGQQDDDENDPVRECTLLLMQLRECRYKKLLDKLCLKLQPLSIRKADRTIFGATLSILGFSVDRVEHVVWAKKEDLRNTPAHVLLSMMMQAGKRGGHLVRYFAAEDHQHPAIVTILQRAHPDCPFCRQF